MEFYLYGGKNLTDFGIFAMMEEKENLTND